MDYKSGHGYELGLFYVEEHKRCEVAVDPDDLGEDDITEHTFRDIWRDE